MRTIRTLDELHEQIGKEVAISPWVRVDQQRIDLFAQATGDQQWIHVDQERASQESAFGTTIAHGYLTLSLLPDLMSQAMTLPPSEMSINYGLNKVRFPRLYFKAACCGPVSSSRICAGCRPWRVSLTSGSSN